MFAVIFRAEVNEVDDAYTAMVARMRELAIDKYGCMEFCSLTDGNHEISISYWKDQELIKHWKHDAEHLLAQELGRSKWYKSYQVQVVEVIREYGNK
jgi:heme-degrading monooxygenase HmoA